jgi:hypothetical protein
MLSLARALILLTVIASGAALERDLVANYAPSESGRGSAGLKPRKCSQKFDIKTISEQLSEFKPFCWLFRADILSDHLW